VKLPMMGKIVFIAKPGSFWVGFCVYIFSYFIFVNFFKILLQKNVQQSQLQLQGASTTVEPKYAVIVMSNFTSIQPLKHVKNPQILLRIATGTLLTPSADHVQLEKFLIITNLASQILFSQIVISTVVTYHVTSALLETHCIIINIYLTLTQTTFWRRISSKMI
jgi:hypothetical protein